MAQLRTPVHSVHLLSFAIAVLILTTILSKSQANVCYASVTTIGSYVVYNQQPQYSQYSYTVGCGAFNWKRCTRYGSSVSYVQGSQTLYNVRYLSTASCCPGYIGSPPNCNPYCTQGCYQGICTLPNVCSCYAGWNGTSCNTDTNECGNANGGCEHYCNNTVGNFTCSCNTGFVLAKDNLNCTDVDECSDDSLNMCSQHCNNTVGSHFCDCYVGYELQNDGITCNDINECTLGISECDHNCTNNISSFQCSCLTGYMLINERNCIDINECNSSNGGCDHFCNNQIGSYDCDCRYGYTLGEDLHECIVAAGIEDYEGNVHLVFHGNDEFEGVLQVYTQGKWNTVCYQLNGSLATNEEAAAAACRQSGYNTFAKLDSANRLGYDLPVNMQPTAIRGIRCPEVKNADTESEIFLLRCDYALELIPTDECDQIVGIQCDKPNENPYNGQIRRSHDGQHSGLLEIYLDDAWKPVCTSQLSSIAADSACRQIGFTHSNQKPISYPDKQDKSWKIKDLSECDKENVSFPCFTNCIKQQSSDYTAVDHCDENQFGIFCQFDKSIDGVFSAGNKYICTYETAESSSPLLYAGIAAIAILGVIFALALVHTGTMITVLCTYRSKCRPGYKNFEGDSSANSNIEMQRQA